jgi:hypothetical protein
MAERDAANRRADRAFETLRAIAVDGLGLTDPWAETATDEAPDEWTGLLSEKVAQLRKERDEACTDAAARLKQMLNQSDIDRRAIGEWERVLGEAVEFLRALLANEATVLQCENAGLLIKKFNSRRGA